ncbi:hypothetical protein QQ045_029528 [Rhodiola kirilowii]
MKKGVGVLRYIRIGWKRRGLRRGSLVEENEDFSVELPRIGPPSVSSLGLKNGFQVPRHGLAGGLALLWKEDVTLTILSYSKYHIDAFIEREEIVRVTVIYGELVTARRGITWELLRELHSQHNLSWIIFGDFNEVLKEPNIRGIIVIELNA